MSFWNFVLKGEILPMRTNKMAEIVYCIGRIIASRQKNVEIAKSAHISPEARICARKGKIEIGEKSTVAANAALQGNIRLGKNCSVQYNTMIVGYGTKDDEKGAVKIGSNVRIAGNCMIISANHIFADREKPICEQGLDVATITIEDDVWIAGGVHIMAGVTVGKGSVIGAGSIVTKDIPPYSVAVGSPAKVIKSR